MNKGVITPLLVFLACLGPPSQLRAESIHRVSIEGMKFVPPSLEVKVGDKIVWKNNDLVPHTVTAPNKAFDSGVIQPNSGWQLVVSSRGKTRYVCTIHPDMTGQIETE